MKVLLVSDTIHAGGAETFVLRLAKKLNQSGVGAEVLSLNPDLEDEDIIKQFSGLCIHRVRLPMLRWIKRFDRLLKMSGIDFSLQYYLTGSIIEEKYLHQYDVFHTHLFPVDHLLAQLKAKHPQVKIVATLHGDYNEFDLFWEQHDSHKKLNWPRKVQVVKEKVDGWAYISGQQLLLLKEKYKVSPVRLHQIYNGYEPAASLELRKAWPTHKKDLTFIMVARGIRPKGWEFLLKAFEQLKGNHHLLLVGKGVFLEELREKYKSDKRMHFTGFHPNPVELINQANVFVFPSVYNAESLPTVVIESLYCGVPVISTRIGEVEAMLTASSTCEKAGIIIEQGTEQEIINTLLYAMNLYISNESILKQHAGLARQAFQKFDMTFCAQQYIRLYESI